MFTKVIHKLHKEYITSSGPTTPDSQALSELLQICLELVKDRVTGMPQEARKGLFTILTSLIEKAPVHRILSIVVYYQRESSPYIHVHYAIPHSVKSLNKVTLCSIYVCMHVSFAVGTFESVLSYVT